jgi:hypothetical protein
LEAGDELFGKDGKDTCFPLGALARAINVPVTEYHVVDAIEESEGKQIVLDGVLADPIGRDGIDRVIFRDRHLARLAVAGTSGPGVYKPFDAMGDGGADQVDSPEDVDLCIKEGLADSAPNVHLCRMMVDDLGLFRDKDAIDGIAIADVALIETAFRVDVLAFAPREVIQNYHFMPVLDVSIGDVGSNKPRASRHKDLHCIAPFQ